MPEQIENRMVVDSEWSWNEPPEAQEKLNRAGYKEIGTGIFVPEEDVFDYTLERISQDEGEREEFVEWFYSNWIKEG